MQVQWRHWFARRWCCRTGGDCDLVARVKKMIAMVEELVQAKELHGCALQNRGGREANLAEA